MSQFEENLKQLPKAEEVVLLRLFNEKDQLLSLIPNVAGKNAALRAVSYTHLTLPTTLSV